MTTHLQTEIENFLFWFIEIEEIPDHKKQEFIDHLLQVGTIDDKAIQFITDTLTNLGNRHQNRANELKGHMNSLEAAQIGETMPEISMKTQIVEYAGEDMRQMAFDFKEDIRDFEREKSEQVENAEEAENHDEVEKLKTEMSA